MDDSIRNLALREIVAKVEALAAERADVRKRRDELAARDREIDRELADCRAAARVFKLQIQFPPDEHEDLDHASAIRRHATYSEALERARQLQRDPRVLVRVRKADNGEPATKPERVAVPVAPPPTIPAAQTKMPRVRDIVLDRLKLAGEAGSKAAPIKEYIDSTYAASIHEKTVGMTLYRLLKEGLVRREGHIWFFVPPSAETKNPGVAAPGLTDLLS